MAVDAVLQEAVHPGGRAAISGAEVEEQEVYARYSSGRNRKGAALHVDCDPFSDPLHYLPSCRASQTTTAEHT